MAKVHIITALDIGTGNLKAIICQKKSEKKEIEILGQINEPSFGVRKGVVINAEEVSNILKSLFNRLREISRKKIKSVYVNINGAHLFSILSHGLISVSRADQKISQEDIERVIQAAQIFPLSPNKEILDVFPKEFIIDNERGIKEPLGLKGVRLEVEALVLGGFSPYLKNLTQAVLGSGFQIDDLILTPLASSRAVLTQREKELGVCLLDIGAGTTGLTIFEEGDLIHLAILPIGSGHITNDLAVGLKCDIEIAERIKLEFGTCLYKGNDKKRKIELLSGETLIFSQKMLSKIIEARVSEIFREVNKELKQISRQASLPGGVVLTGGGSKLPKIKDLAKKELKLHSKIGIPQGFSPSIEEPEFSVLGGLVLLGLDYLEAEDSLPTFEKGILSKFKKIFRIFLP